MTARLSISETELRRPIDPSVNVLPLTPRLRDVFFAIGVGYRAPQIARSLGISTYTVETEMKELYRRLGVSGHRGVRSLILAMVLEAVRGAIVDPQPPPEQPRTQ
jgi:DNA-binding NarL/FixJ family response regulator